MRHLTKFQRVALFAFLSVELLLFVGAAVRASGSGLGCPDWPFCYGQMIPPMSAEGIDFERLDLERFRLKAAQFGREPGSITVESLRAEFDPVATWIEYLNRLTSLPVGLSVLILLVASVGEWRAGRVGVGLASVAAVLLVGVNAWLGARVVLSGLQPGIITLHMALAILLLCVLVFTVWAGCGEPWRLRWVGLPVRGLVWLGWALFALVVLEGVMGSQVRELTDELAKSHAGESRASWIGELEGSVVYLVHRSFSWVLVVAALVFGYWGRRSLKRLGRLEMAVVGLILMQMVLGVVLAHWGVFGVVQVLHVGLSSLLVSALFLWLLGGMRSLQSGVAEAGGRA